MINEKLDSILKDIEKIKEIFNNDDYFKNLENMINKRNKYMQSLERKASKRQDKIDRVFEILNEGLNELNTRNRSEVYVEEYFENAIDIIKEKE